MGGEEKEGPTRPRRSLGGHVVEDSLWSVGFRSEGMSVALVETVKPNVRPFEVVVCQNAWNFIPHSEFASLLRPYPLKSAIRYRARRVVAAMNVRRAHKVVALSDYMGGLLATRGIEADVIPICLPADLEAVDAVPLAALLPGSDFWLIPGSVTWYKNPRYVVELAKFAALEGRPPLLVFAGSDDDSGCRDSLQRELAAAKLDAYIGAVTRAEMLWLLREAEVTILPSELESLSLSFIEALLLSRRVWARPLPVHVEMAKRVARDATWLPDLPDCSVLATLHTKSALPQGGIAIADGQSAWLQLRRTIEHARRRE